MIKIYMVDPSAQKKITKWVQRTPIHVDMFQKILDNLESEGKVKEMSPKNYPSEMHALLEQTKLEEKGWKKYFIPWDNAGQEELTRQMKDKGFNVKPFK